ncbi:serine/threonine-protein kinase [Streptomyces sp. NPDC013178]|uniref:serine/threonine-protein kinase n=1 Tax=unclassified Streptomyces TaxID=2593676 RepID=UPI0033DD43F1
MGALSVGTEIDGRYRAVRPIGRGGMGEVWEARDERLDRRVAVKLIRADLAHESVAARFRREAKVLARIQHPNIVAVHDIGIRDTQPYIVMELLEGLDLDSVLDEGPLDPALVRAVAAGMCEGLQAAHEAGVLHRDIKPSNVHLTRQGRVVLQDFGIAALLVGDIADTALTVTGQIVGTPQYMPPELVQSHAVGPPADLYSVGACMYAMLTGRAPLPADSAFAVLYKVVNEGLPDLSGEVPGVPEDLARLVTDLVRIVPDQRPTIQEVVGRLQAPADAEALIAAAVTGGVRDRAIRRFHEAVTSVADEDEASRIERPEPDTPYPAVGDGPSLELGLSRVTRQHILSAMTPQTAEVRLREAVGLVLRGELADAGELLAAVQVVCDRVLGAEHPTTLTARYWYAVCLARLGAAGEALTAFSNVMDRTVRAGLGHAAPRSLEGTGASGAGRRGTEE